MNLLTIPSNMMTLIERSKHGVTKEEIKDLQAQAQLTNDQLAAILHLTPRALQKYQPLDVLRASVSERALALAQLYARGFEFMGEERFLRWMNRQHLSLGGRRPIDLLDTHFGMVLIGDELGRIEQGVLA
ncbi:MAG: DUF2384 domain-containing protein [Cyclobacteriaceae bacterium]